MLRFHRRNEKYAGNALLGKTFVEDCLTHKNRINNGEQPQYYATDSHPAIIDKGTWNRVQEELARRGRKRKVKEKGTKTDQGKYSRYALTELLCCGECGTPYRRCTWSKNGKKKIVWRCISRLDHGKKYCKESPSLEESVLHRTILDAVGRFVGTDVPENLKRQIGIGLSGKTGGDNPYKIQAKIGEIDKALSELYQAAACSEDAGEYESRFEALYTERKNLNDTREQIRDSGDRLSAEQSRLADLFAAVDHLRNQSLEWDERMIWQMIECVKVTGTNKLAIRFRSGTEIEASIG